MTRKIIGLILILSLFLLACAGLSGVPGLGQPTPTALSQPTDLPTDVPTETAAPETTEAATQGAQPTDQATDASADVATDTPEPTDTPTLQDLSSDVVSTIKMVQQIKVPGVGQIAISPNSDQLAAAQGNSILIYDMPWPADPTATLSGHTGKVNSVSWSSDGSQLVSGSDDGTIRIWNMADGTEASKLTIDGSPVLAVAWSPDGSLIAAGTRKGVVELIDPTKNAVTLTIQVSPDNVPLGAITWSSDASELGTALYQGSVNPGDIELWDATTGDPLDSGKNARSYTAPGPTGIAWSPTDEIMAWVSHNKKGQVSLWAVGSDKNSVAYSAQDGVDSIAWGPNGDMVATAGADHTIQIWDPTDGTNLAKLTGSHDTITTVAWSADETFLVSASADGLVSVWGSPQ